MIFLTIAIQNKVFSTSWQTNAQKIILFLRNRVKKSLWSSFYTAYVTWLTHKFNSKASLYRTLVNKLIPRNQWERCRLLIIYWITKRKSMQYAVNINFSSYQILMLSESEWHGVNWSRVQLLLHLFSLVTSQVLYSNLFIILLFIHP